MSAISAVTVFCSSSKSVAPIYFQAAAELGTQIARCKWTLIYGGNNVGTMGALADAVRAGGGRVVGITPQLLVDKGIADPKCDELIVTADMRQRKSLLEQRGDAFIALPGGIGTLEEVFEILVGRYLGLHTKPIVLLNINGFYRPLLDMLDQATHTGFIRKNAHMLFHAADSIDAAIRHLRSSRATAPIPEPRRPSGRSLSPPDGD